MKQKCFKIFEFFKAYFHLFRKMYFLGKTVTKSKLQTLYFDSAGNLTCFFRNGINNLLASDIFHLKFIFHHKFIFLWIKTLKQKISDFYQRNTLHFLLLAIKH